MARSVPLQFPAFHFQQNDRTANRSFPARKTYRDKFIPQR